MAPESTTVQPRKVSQVLVFNLSTGYQHWVIPHTSALMEVLGEKTGAFKMKQSVDIQVFENNFGICPRPWVKSLTDMIDAVYANTAIERKKLD